MPIDYKRYPPNWKTELRPAVLTRAQNACECCGVKNYTVTRSSAENYLRYAHNHESIAEARKTYEVVMGSDFPYDDWIIIVLTVAHLDHDISHNELSNLKALCQRCHLNYDRKDNTRRRKFGKHYENGQLKVNLIFKDG